MFDLSGLRIPVVQAPMAGGVSTVAMAAAVCEAGALGFLAAGYKSAASLTGEIRALRARTAHAFGVNLFVPGPPPDPASLAPYRAELAAEAERYGVELPEPDPGDDDHWAGKLAALTGDPVPVVSFTFGLPPAAAVRDLHEAGTYLIATVTSPAEARVAASLGVDALCLQGPGAGGHRGCHDQAAVPDDTPLPESIARVRREAGLPLIAAGGLATGGDIAAALRAGAQAVQLGTAYLRCDESGAAPAHRRALTDPRFTATVVTRAFSGRPARALRNRFTDAHDAAAPVGYPLVNQLTRPLRAAAAARDDADGLALWAGVGYRYSLAAPAAAVTTRLWQAARAELDSSPAGSGRAR